MGRLGDCSQAASSGATTAMRRTTAMSRAMRARGLRERSLMRRSRRTAAALRGSQTR